ncbi:MAG: DUF1517 domain-containing protein [Elainellaceae cyanobacterium]
MKPFLKTLLVFGLMAALVFGHASDAMAARAGGRMGGGSFRAPRSYVRPSPSRAPRGGGYGGGFGFPFLFPLFGFGGGFGGLFTIVIFIAIANFLVRSFQNATSDNEYGYGNTTVSPKLTVARLQVGLLADARELQADLNRMAENANTSSTQGLAQVLQEATLSLLRHPEYWVYGDSNVSQTRLESAEAEFNRMALIERSKFSKETLSNVNSQVQRTDTASAADSAAGELAMAEAPGEYIVATLVVAAQGKLDLPKIQNSEDLRRALSQLGSVSSDELVALEVLWTPQIEGDTLSSDEVVASYPSLNRI